MHRELAIGFAVMIGVLIADSIIAWHARRLLRNPPPDPKTRKSI